MWTKNSLSIPIDSGITNFWILLFVGATYQRGDEADERCTDEQLLSDKPLMMQCGENYSAWQL